MKQLRNFKSRIELKIGQKQKKTQHLWGEQILIILSFLREIFLS